MKLGNLIPWSQSWRNLPDLQAVDDTMRDRINTARVICVLLMIYVHVPGGLHGSELVQTDLSSRVDYWLQLLFVEGPGRASAALLSVVSGYLVAVTLLRRSSPRSAEAIFNLYKRRATSIVLPMFVWALVTCLIYAVLVTDGTSFVSQAEGTLAKLNLVLFITESPYGATMHLGFLRDLFVCVLLSPLLILAVRMVPILTLGALTLLYLASANIEIYIVLRPLVVLCFSIGIFLALQQVNLGMLDKYWPVFLILMLTYSIVIIMTHAGFLNPLQETLASQGVSLLESVLYPLCRLSGSLAIWCMLPLLGRSASARLTASFSPYLFAAFCSHLLVLSILFRALWVPVIGEENTYAYMVWFILAPLVAMLVAICTVSVASKIHPRLAMLLTGGRVRPTDAVVVKDGKYARTT